MEIPRIVDEDGSELLTPLAIQPPSKLDRFLEVWLSLVRQPQAAIGAANGRMNVGFDLRLVGCGRQPRLCVDAGGIVRVPSVFEHRLAEYLTKCPTLLPTAQLLDLDLPKPNPE